LARLDFLRESGSPLGLLLGPAGSGKSAVLCEFAERAARAGAQVAPVAGAGSDDILISADIALGLAAGFEGDTSQVWRRLTDRLAELKLEGVAALVLVDDLDRASTSGLVILERLLSLPDAGLTIVASSRTETVGRIGPRLIEQAALRIDLAPWSEDETRDYVQSSLADAGRGQPAFNSSAVRRLHELSGGTPRRVNQLAELSLVAGAGRSLSQIDAETIDAVQEELSVGR
jgi:DamX protein